MPDKVLDLMQEFRNIARQQPEPRGKRPGGRWQGQKSHSLESRPLTETNRVVAAGQHDAYRVALGLEPRGDQTDPAYATGFKRGAAAIQADVERGDWL